MKEYRKRNKGESVLTSICISTQNHSEAHARKVNMSRLVDELLTSWFRNNALTKEDEIRLKIKDLENRIDPLRTEIIILENRLKEIDEIRKEELRNKEREELRKHVEQHRPYDELLED